MKLYAAGFVGSQTARKRRNKPEVRPYAALARISGVRSGAGRRAQNPVVQADAACFDVAAEVNQWLFDDDSDVADFGWRSSGVSGSPARFHRIEIQIGGKR